MENVIFYETSDSIHTYNLVRLLGGHDSSGEIEAAKSIFRKLMNPDTNNKVLVPILREALLDANPHLRMRCLELLNLKDEFYQDPVHLWEYIYNEKHTGVQRLCLELLAEALEKHKIKLTDDVIVKDDIHILRLKVAESQVNLLRALVK